MRIGELASYAGCSTDAIRFYERKGLLRRAGRSSGNHRVYGTQSLTILQLIVRCRNLGLPLSEVKTLVAALDDRSSDCEAVATVFDRQIALVRARIAELMAVERALQDSRNACPRPVSAARCGILRKLQTVE